MTPYRTPPKITAACKIDVNDYIKFDKISKKMKLSKSKILRVLLLEFLERPSKKLIKKREI